MELIFGYLLIFVARLVDVSMATMRTLMVVQGRRWPAAIIGFFEITIYVLALGKVVNNLSNPFNLLSYSLGFATGNFVGITIENKIALGKLAVKIILKTEQNDDLIDGLRGEGFGVTVVSGEGREGTREILNIIIDRKRLQKLRDVLSEYDDTAFITVNSINPISGGYFSPKKK
jgi:uncharacterized protein YebE (UPF0316 family)